MPAAQLVESCRGPRLAWFTATRLAGTAGDVRVNKTALGTVLQIHYASGEARAKQNVENYLRALFL